MELKKWTCLAALAACAGLVACGKTPPPAEPTAVPAAPPPAQAAPASPSADLGVALYPGMETLTAAHHIPGGPTVADFKSADKPEKVLAFYRELLGKKAAEGAQFMESPMAEGMTRIQGTDGKRGFTILVRPEGGGSIVGIQVLGTGG